MTAVDKAIARARFAASFADDATSRAAHAQYIDALIALRAAMQE